ncbi:MAG: phosphoribosylformylglycinamidine synthase subunit PurS [Gemmatimonadota bacterium]
MSRPLRARVEVTLRRGIRDPQGQAIEDALHRLGYDGIAEVRVGKHVTFEIAGPRPEAERRIAEVCERLLANPVIEDYAWTLEAGDRGEEREDGGA